MNRYGNGLALVLAASLLVSCGAFSKKTGQRGAQPKRPVAGATTPPPAKGDPQARFAAAVQMMKERKLPDAEAALVALTRDFPQNSGPYTNLGILYAKSNRRNEAIAALTQATSLNSKNAVAWNWLGIVLRESSDPSSAERSYNRALQINPDYALAHLNLGILYDTYLGRPADALGHYRRYQQLAGKDELRVAAWIAEIEAKHAIARPAPALPQPQPVSTKPRDESKGSLLPVRKP